MSCLRQTPHRLRSQEQLPDIEHQKQRTDQQSKYNEQSQKQSAGMRTDTSARHADLDQQDEQDLVAAGQLHTEQDSTGSLMRTKPKARSSPIPPSGPQASLLCAVFQSTRFTVAPVLIGHATSLIFPMQCINVILQARSWYINICACLLNMQEP